jgi:hypothetical protein
MGLGAFIAGCGGGGVVPTDRPPTITEAALTPTELPAGGGTVTITVGATDDRQVVRVTARINGPDGVRTIALSLVGSTYQATYAAPPNPGPDDQAYAVQVTARDNGGNTSAPRQLAFIVQSPAGAPSITDAGVIPAELRFPGGTVSVEVTVANSGGVSAVSAEVTGPSGTSTVALTGGGPSYHGTYVAAANPGPNDQRYGIEVIVRDSQGDVCDSATLAFTVKAPSQPPEEPPL